MRGAVRRTGRGSGERWWAIPAVWAVLLGSAFLWSCGSASRFPFTFPDGVAIDANGAIYVADTSNNRIVRMDDMSGTNSVAFGSLGGDRYQFNTPIGIAVDANFHIYVADARNYRIVEMDDMSGTNWTDLGAYGSGDFQFAFPKGIAVDATGKIYVTDAGNGRIVQLDDMTKNAGTWHAFGTSGQGTGQFSGPSGIDVDSGGGIYVADYANNRIVRVDDISGSGWASLGNTAPGPGRGINQFYGPFGITVTSSGQILVADSQNNRIVQIDDIGGTNWTSLGGTNPGVGKNQFNAPGDVALGNANSVFSIFVCDTGNSRIAAMTDITGLDWTTYP
ncbi:MAG TPA: NHL repeat-containing protein [Nitrospiria bacterium]|nr:NHL repeat-containing protein [Nitrospiria bacterium]